MSKKAKKSAKEKNLRAKRARKAANRAKYERFRELGINSKSKRASKNKKSKLKGTHPFTPCGNLACQRCYINDGESVRRRTAEDDIQPKKKGGILANLKQAS